MVRTLMIVAALIVTPAAHAAPKSATAPASVVAGQETLSLEVKGLVCDFCARSVEKVFLRKGKAQTVKVDMDAGRVDVVLKPGATLSDEQAKKLITDSGYNLVKITRAKAGGAS